MVTYKLHIVRHGLCSGNIEGRYVGRLDLPLCSEGIQDLEELRRENEYPKVECVYTSPLRRARQTADILFPDTGMILVDDMNELSLGEFEGRDFSSLKNDPSYLKWLQNSKEYTPKGALETSEEFAARVAVGFNSIIMNMGKQNIREAALVTHGGVIMNIMNRFCLTQRPIGEWSLEAGHGYTIRTSAQMWMRDETFEIIGQLPY